MSVRSRDAIFLRLFSMNTSSFPFALISLYFSTSATFRFSAFFMWNPAGGVELHGGLLDFPRRRLAVSPPSLRLGHLGVLAPHPLGLIRVRLWHLRSRAVSGCLGPRLPRPTPRRRVSGGAVKMSSREFFFPFRGVLSWISSRPQIAQHPRALEQIVRAMLAPGATSASMSARPSPIRRVTVPRRRVHGARRPASMDPDKPARRQVRVTRATGDDGEDALRRRRGGHHRRGGRTPRRRRDQRQEARRGPPRRLHRRGGDVPHEALRHRGRARVARRAHLRRRLRAAQDQARGARGAREHEGRRRRQGGDHGVRFTIHRPSRGRRRGPAERVPPRRQPRGDDRRHRRRRAGHAPDQPAGHLHVRQAPRAVHPGRDGGGGRDATGRPADRGRAPGLGLWRRGSAVARRTVPAGRR